MSENSPVQPPKGDDQPPARRQFDNLYNDTERRYTFGVRTHLVECAKPESQSLTFPSPLSLQPYSHTATELRSTHEACTLIRSRRFRIHEYGVYARITRQFVFLPRKFVDASQNIAGERRASRFQGCWRDIFVATDNRCVGLRSDELCGRLQTSVRGRREEEEG